MYNLFLNPIDHSLFTNISKDIKHGNIQKHQKSDDRFLEQHPSQTESKAFKGF